MKKEAMAVREARRLHIPVVGLVDTNCDPDEADFVIPGNDDAIRASDLIVRVLADAVADGRKLGSAADFAAAARRAAAPRPPPRLRPASRGGRWRRPAAEAPAPAKARRAAPAAEPAAAVEAEPAGAGARRGAEAEPAEAEPLTRRRE